MRRFVPSFHLFSVLLLGLWQLELQQLFWPIRKKVTPKGWWSIKLEGTWVPCDLWICHSSPGLLPCTQERNTLLSCLNHCFSSVYYHSILTRMACEALSHLALTLFLNSLMWLSLLTVLQSHWLMQSPLLPFVVLCTRGLSFSWSLFTEPEWLLIKVSAEMSAPMRRLPWPS